MDILVVKHYTRMNVNYAQLFLTLSLVRARAGR